jgi:hypothetical protein
VVIERENWSDQKGGSDQRGGNQVLPVAMVFGTTVFIDIYLSTSPPSFQSSNSIASQSFPGTPVMSKNSLSIGPKIENGIAHLLKESIIQQGPGK